MATRIPLPGNMIDTLMKGVSTGSNMYSGIMNPIISRENMANTKKIHDEQLAQQMKIHQDSIALQRATQARLDAMAPLQRRMTELSIKKAEMETDPLKKMAYIKQIMQGIHGMGAEQQPESMTNQNQMTEQNVNAPSPETIQQGFGDSQSMGGFNFSPEQQMALGMAGIKIPTPHELPEHKRFAELQNKIKFEQEKTALKKKVLEDKEIVAAKKDIPTIKNSIQGVDELLKIAKSNPDMFGHTFMPDIYAKTSKNKNFGTWQNLIADRIAGLEGKLSARGNVMALKMASSLKPSHAESQQVAIGKLESMKKELQKQLQRSMDLTGQKNQKYNDNDLVVVEGPNGEETMTYAQARQLGAQ